MFMIISSLTQEFRSVFKISSAWNFFYLSFCYWLKLTVVWSENVFYVIPIFWNLWRLAFWLVFCMWLKRMHILQLLGKISSQAHESCCSNFLIFFLLFKYSLTLFPISSVLYSFLKIWVSIWLFSLSAWRIFLSVS